MEILEQLIILAPVIALLDALITLYVHLQSIKFQDEQKILISAVGSDVRSVRLLQRPEDKTNVTQLYKKDDDDVTKHK